MDSPIKLLKRNGVAKALLTPLYHQRVIKDKRQDTLIKHLEKETKKCFTI